MSTKNLNKFKELKLNNKEEELNNFIDFYKNTEYLKKYVSNHNKNKNKKKHISISPENRTSYLINKNNDLRKINLTQEKKLILSHYSELDHLEQKFTELFIQEAKKKTEKEIRATLPQKKIDYENRIKLVLAKAEKEVITYNDKYKTLEKKNLELKNKIKMLNMQKVGLYKDLESAELTIAQIHKKYELFSKLKPYYDNLVLEFNIKNKDIEEKKFDLKKDIKDRKAIANEVGNELKDKIENFIDLKNNMKEEQKYNKKYNEDLYDQFTNLENKHKLLEEEYKKKINDIQQDILSNQSLQRENDLIQNSFISIYNLLYKNLNLQRDIIENPKNINLIKSDYTPQTYITEEFMRYINLMLINSTDESCGLLLREIASYANMMLRESVEGFDKTKYEPIKTVHEIEKYISKVKKENKSLNSDIEKIKKENSKENEYIDKIKKQIDQINKMYDSLHTTIKMIYTNKDVDNKIKKSLSANNIDYLGGNGKKKGLSEEENDKRFIYLRKNLEVKKKVNDIQFQKEFEALVHHTNRIVCYQKQNDIRPKDVGIYVNAHKRMKNKFYKLKKLEEKKNKFLTIESALKSNINEKVNKLLFKINY